MTSTGLTPPLCTAACRPWGRLPFALGPHGFLLFALGLLWLVPAAFDRRAVLAMILWDAAVLAVAFVDLRRIPPPADIEISRRWAGVPTIGAPLRVSIELHNRGDTAIDGLATDYVSGSLRADLPDLHLEAPPRAVASADYELAPRQRGDGTAGHVAFRWRSGWGFAERRGIASLDQTVRVYPDLQQGQREALFLIRSQQIAIERRRGRRTGLGREFESLRDYQPGDEPRHICWKASARRRRLVTRTYEPERSQTVWILVDSGRLLRARVAAQTMLDHAVTGALTLAQVATAAGDNVGLLAYGRDVQQRIPPGRGSGSLRHLVDAFAQLRGESVEANHAGAVAELLRVQPRRALVVWMTEIAETAGIPDVIEQASAMMRRHVVLFTVPRHQEVQALAAGVPDAAGGMYRLIAAEEALQRRDALLRDLERRGVAVLEASPAELGSGLVDRYLEIKDRGVL